MTKDEIITAIEELPRSIGHYKLYIYEDSQLEPWDKICTKGALNHSKLHALFDENGNIKHYDFDEKLEYQFTINYDFEGMLLFKKPHFGKLADCLTTIKNSLAGYYEQV